MKVDFADEFLVGLDVLKGCCRLDSRRRLGVVFQTHGFAAREDEVGNGKSYVPIADLVVFRYACSDKAFCVTRPATGRQTRRGIQRPAARYKRGASRQNRITTSGKRVQPITSKDSVATVP
jgi:hypothetical protein